MAQPARFEAASELNSFSNPPEAVKKIHSWFESLTTNGFQVPSFKHLAVRPELRRRATAIFSQLPFVQRGTFSARIEPSLEKRGKGRFLSGMMQIF
jgi:hypothetical protein